jgi:cell division transport system permease protein
MNTALKNIRRTPYQSIGLSLILTLNIFIIAIFILVSGASHIILTHFETKPQVIAYLKDDATQDQINETINSLNNTDKVKDVVFISKQKALEIYKKSVGNDPLLLGTVTELGEVTADILPASIEVSVNTPTDFDQVVSILEESSVVNSTPTGEKEIDFPQSVIKELVNWTRAIRISGLILITVLAFISTITTTLTIGSKISSRRTEIKTMKLLGARNFYVLKPYLLESVLFGAMSAFLGWLFAYISLLYATPFLIDRLAGILTLPVSPLLMLSLLGVLIIFGSLLGLFAGLLASVRFLNR